MLLQDLLYKTSVNAVNGSTAIPINALQIDSRAIQKGNCFIAIKGTKTVCFLQKTKSA